MLSQEQSEALGLAAQAHANLLIGKQTLQSEIQKHLEARLENLEYMESWHMNAALAAGVPKNRIADAVGTSNWNTLQAKYALAARHYAIAARIAG